MNTLSTSKYRVQKKFIEQFIKDRPNEPKEYLATIIALATHCPILVVCQFIGESEGFTEDLNKLIEDLKVFYNIDTII